MAKVSSQRKGVLFVQLGFCVDCYEAVKKAGKFRTVPRTEGVMILKPSLFTIQGILLN